MAEAVVVEGVLAHVNYNDNNPETQNKEGGLLLQK
jgi:hypothetical protein